jgi:hypothetical protein
LQSTQVRVSPARFSDVPIRAVDQRAPAWTRWRRLLTLILAPAVLALLPAAAFASEEADKCASAPNPNVCENALPGDAPSNWQVQGVGDPTIQGYATSMSVDVGQTEYFKIDTPSSSYHINILRLGYYGGDGARLVASNIKPTATLPQTQPECLTEASTGLIDCGNWGVSAQWTVPTNAVSGVFIAQLVRNDTGGESQIPFVVRNDSSHSDILLQTSDATWEAYNDYGGNSLYTCTVACPPGNPKAYKGAYAVSYNRPFDGAFTTDNGASYLYYAEYQMIYWLEENGYNVSYTSEAEVDNNGALLKNHKVFMSSGHDEYWSAGQRANVEAAREAGVNLTFFSGNEIFWKTRWGPSTEGSNTPYRTLTTYKETHFEGPVDPNDPPTWTGAWRDPRGGPSDDGGKPENALTGQQFEVNSGTAEITVPAQYGKERLWRNTAVANLKPEQTLTLAPNTGTLGYEWDEDVDNGFRPAGEFDLSSTTVSGVQAFTDYGSTLTSNATATHHLTLYRAPSGALVFGAGTVQWSWGLADVNAWDVGTTEPAREPADPNMEQFTVNLLAEMGAQPGSLLKGLFAAEKSTVTTAPTSTITSPAQGETLQDGSQVVIAGTAKAAAGAVVAGVEVSTDNGATWHPATLTTPAERSVNWSYTWAAHGIPTTTIKSRAVDDSANLESPAAGVQVNVSCPCSIWGTAVTPPTPDSGDTHSTELGVKFTSETFGVLTGVRFYKSAANTGTHIGSLWSASGQLLASATFTSETESGWQQVNFSTPVDIFPNTTYVAAYFDPNGHYADSQYYFYTPPPTGGNALNSPPLHAVPANTAPVNGAYVSENGLFSYSAVSTFPASSFNGTNYWVDPVFVPSVAPGQVTNVSATASTGSATVTWSAPSGGGPVTTYTITPYIGSEAQPVSTVTGTPPVTSVTIKGLTDGAGYTFTVQASNPDGAGPVSAASNVVMPTALTVPGAPTEVLASAATSQALLSWAEPASNGGSAITGYILTPYKSGVAQTPVEVTGSATSAIVKGLTNGTGYTFTVTALNAIGSGSPSAASATVTPQDTIFDFATPATIDSGDGSSVNVGVKFSSEAAGSITGIRFYKAAANTGTHVGSLWSASGTLLASATFTGETASGWQQVSFSSPVAISANTTYVVSYLAPKGHYSVSSSAFTSAGVSNPPLQALANTVSANGVYFYSSSTVFPTNTYKATNYWVDVDFTPTPVPGQVTNVSATAGPGSASVSWSAPTEGGAVTSYTVTPYIGSEAQPAMTVSGSPPATSTMIEGLTNGTSYTFKVRASNGNGSGPLSAASNSVTPLALTVPGAPTGVAASAATSQVLVSWSEPASNGGSTITGYKVTPYKGGVAQTPLEVGGGATSATVKGLTNGASYTFTVTAANTVGSGAPSSASNAVTPQDTIFDFATPATIDSGDTTAVEVGVKFSSEVSGSITGIRFYKAATNTGTHVGSLWSASGTLLASATFTGETASGWQQVNFSTPVAIAANTTYVAGYLAPKGHYSDTSSAFTSAGVSNGPLSALANTVSANGVYAYSSSSVFPTSTYKATNYWVDVDFAPNPPPGQVTNVSATAGPGSANVSWSAPSEGGTVTTYTVTPYIGSEAQPATTVSGSPPATGVTVKGLTNGTSYTFTVQASNPIGAGPASAASNAVTPLASTVPGAPSEVVASGATSQALVSWAEPSNGGSAISSYTITPYKSGVAQTPLEVGGGTPSAIVKGLTNGASYTFTVTATNGVGGSQPSSASNAVTPRDTIFDFAAPATADSGETSSTEVGVKFGSEVSGSITGIRFYKAAANTGTHIGSLWSASGTLLASATFTGETASGWQQVNFSSPVAINAYTTYVAGYLAPKGHYSATAQAFEFVDVSNPPLEALASPISANGVFSYSSSSVFPTSTNNATNYWVDVDFAPTPVPGHVTNVSATAGPGSASVSWSAPSEGGPVTEYTITPYIGSEAQPGTTVSGSPPATSATIKGLTAGTSYTFTVRASNANGSGPVSGESNAVTPSALTVPGAPSEVVASGATGQALVSWAEPASNGGSAITGYTVTPYVGSTAQTPLEVGAGATSAIVKGLTNSTSYTFTVTASNTVGSGAPSSASNAVTPQDTIFDFATPATVDSGETSSTEVGVKFSSEVAGNITGIRFYKAAANTGTHIGSLWSASGTLLASATFTGETASGWQQVNFSSPVTIAANTTYVAGYLAPKGHYSVSSSAFASAGVSNPPLQALANPVSANGVYAISSTSTFPTSTFNASNYWVDVDFMPTALPGQVTNVSATAGQGSATVTWSAPSEGGPVTAYTITPYIGSEAQTATTVMGAPPVTNATIKGLTPGKSYTFTVRASNANGSGPASGESNAVTPLALTAPGAPTGVAASGATGQALVSWTEPASNGGSAITGYTVTPYVGSTAQTPLEVGAGASSAIVKGLANGTSYTFTVTAANAIGSSSPSTASNAVTPQDTIFDFATPATVDSGDPASTELGVKFSSETYGAVTGIRFYKAAANTGTHIGSLWSSSGTLLASATFSSEGASGWQQVSFSTPVYISPNTTYVAAYLAPKGHYSITSSAFATIGVSNGPLSALANTISANGVYSYTATSAFPTSTNSATNYWVDVDFTPAPVPGQVTNVSATAGNGAATVTWNAPSGGGPVTTYTVTPYVGSEAQSATTVTGTPPATSVKVGGLTNGTAYTFVVTASNPNGAGLASEHSGAVTPTSIAPPSAPTGLTASAATAQALLSWTEPTSNGGGAITGYKITPYVGSTAQTPLEVGASTTSAIVKGLTNGTSYTFTVTAANAAGSGPASTASGAVTPEDTIFDFATPTTINSGDAHSTELGVKFSSEVAGTVTGIRFYKASTNTGTHVGSLWSASGTLLASATFTGETASGWQQVNFSTPVSIAANTTYVAGYLAPKGDYSDTSSGFATGGVTNGPLSALANSLSANGVYIYSSTSVFPTSTYKATNYWVDVDFAPGG